MQSWIIDELNSNQFSIIYLLFIYFHLVLVSYSLKTADGYSENFHSTYSCCVPLIFEISLARFLISFSFPFSFVNSFARIPHTIRFRVYNNKLSHIGFITLPSFVLTFDFIFVFFLSFLTQSLSKPIIKHIRSAVLSIHFIEFNPFWFYFLSY